MKKCPYCREKIFETARKCKHCGEWLPAEWASGHKQVVTKNHGIAALLSLIIPGAGSIYANKVGKGITLLILTIIGYTLFVIPGIIMHIVSIIIAAADTT